MNEKLIKQWLQLTDDLNEFLFNEDSIFEEFPLVFSTIGYNHQIRFNEDIIVDSEGCLNWKEVIEELERLAETYSKLSVLTRKFFKKFTNEEIEEKYYLGIEEEV